MPTEGYFQPALREELKGLIKSIKNKVPELKTANNPTVLEFCLNFVHQNYDLEKKARMLDAVSYTHLTLPTTPYV